MIEEVYHHQRWMVLHKMAGQHTYLQTTFRQVHARVVDTAMGPAALMAVTAVQPSTIEFRKPPKWLCRTYPLDE